MEKIEVKQEELQGGVSLKPGDEGYVEPASVEQQLVAQEQQKLQEFMENEEEMASLAIKMYTPRFRALVDQLKKRQLQRVLKSLIEHPLKEYKHDNATEKQAFAVGQALFDAKMILIFHTFNNNKDKIFETMAQEAAKNATLEFGDKAEAIMAEENNEQQKEVISG